MPNRFIIDEAITTLVLFNYKAKSSGLLMSELTSHIDWISITEQYLAALTPTLDYITAYHCYFADNSHALYCNSFHS